MTKEKPLSEKKIIYEGCSKFVKVSNDFFYHCGDLGVYFCKKCDLRVYKAKYKEMTLKYTEQIRKLTDYKKAQAEAVDRLKLRSTGVTHCYGFIKLIEEEFGDLK